MSAPRRLLVGLATVGALGGSALIGRQSVAQAGFGGDGAVLVSMRAHRAGTVVACSGACRVGAANGTDSRLCPLDVRPEPVSFNACLTALTAACTTACKTTP